MNDDELDGLLRRGFAESFPQCGAALREHLDDHDTGHVIATFQAVCLSTLWTQSADKVGLTGQICRYADSLLATGAPDLSSIVRITLLRDVADSCEGFLHNASTQLENGTYSPELRAYVTELTREAAGD